ncbi:hypothetical protein Acr_12g0002770 [Actinidia rufa]|uniref:Uncharacterized protein n=1 Tax=Actinidia rufa TaxID=165716 RepID=A0A7J0FH23_9ERIC|nr:hypothetical protein Acr_12g0002770 [Actinidia rufa]
MVNTKYAVNAPRENTGSSNSPRATLRKKFFKNERIQSCWAEFQHRNIITGRNIEESFKPKYRQKMLEPARVLGWNTLIPLPKNVYSDLVRSAIEDPLNLNYIILREMAYVRTHKNRSLPYGALLTKIFEHFEVNLRNQSIQTIDEGFSSYMISRGITVDSTDEEDDLEMPSQAMGDVHMEDVSLDTEIPPEQSPQPQEGQTSQEKSPDWFIQYFGQLRTTMERIEKTQKENNEYMKTKMDSIEQRQILNDKLHELHGTYIDRLGDNYEQLYIQQTKFHQECLDRLKAVQTLVEAESHFQYDPPPFSPHSQALMNLKGTRESNSFLISPPIF